MGTLEWLLGVMGVKLPGVFTYLSTRMLLASFTSLTLTLLLGDRVIRFLLKKKIGSTIRVEDPKLVAQHEGKQRVPTMGGVLPLGAMLVSLLIWGDFSFVTLWLLVWVTLLFALLGWTDDRLKLQGSTSEGLSPREKFFIQFLFTLGVALYLFYPPLTEWVSSYVRPPTAQVQVWRESQAPGGMMHVKAPQMVVLQTKEYMQHYFLPFVKTPVVLQGWWYLPLMILFMMVVLIGSANAVNLTDGLDGLATGSVLLSAAVFSVFAFLSSNRGLAYYLNIPYIVGSSEIAVFLSALFGATLGFLWFNCSPAEVFMGDTGSLAFGGILGLTAILLRREFLLALVGGVFVIETLSVILQVASYKLRNKKRIFLCAPLHHHFELKGWPETKVVLRFWIIALILALVGVLSLKLQ